MSKSSPKTTKRKCQVSKDVASLRSYNENGVLLGGLKSISTQLFTIFQTKPKMTYENIMKNVKSSNQNTLRRRVYDVLTVFRALGYVQKQNKEYIKTDICLLTPQSCISIPENNLHSGTASEDENKTKISEMNDLKLRRTLHVIRKRVVSKRADLKNLTAIRNSLRFIIERNKRCVLFYDKLVAPFVLVTTNKNVQVNCETNEERDFFRIQSKEPISIVDDLTVMKQIYEDSGNSKIIFETDDIYGTVT